MSKETNKPENQFADNLFEQMTNITKASAYDILLEQHKKLEDENKKMKYDLEMNDIAANVSYKLVVEDREKLQARVKELEEALKPLANLDLTGVNGSIVYVRNKSEILLNDVIKAKELLTTKY